MRFLICGAGPLGTLLSLLLKQSGADITLLARGERYNELKKDGIQILPLNSTDVIRTQVSLINQLPTNQEYDVAFVVMRKNKAVILAQQMTKNLPAKRIIFLGNNPNGFDTYKEYYSSDQYLLGFLMAAGHTEKNITTSYYDVKDIIRIGINPGDPHSLEKVISIQQELAKYGIGVSISPDINAWLKYHAVLIAPLAGLMYRTNCDVYELPKHIDWIKTALRAIREGMNALFKLGFQIEPPSIKKFRWLPIGLMSKILAKRLASKNGEIALAAHARSAFDEMEPLMKEVYQIILKANMTLSNYNEILSWFIQSSFNTK